MYLTLICGGPGSERDISLDSTRTFYDSVRSTFGDNCISVVYVDRNSSFSRLDKLWLYANTCSDFDSSFTAERSRGLTALTSYDLKLLFNRSDAIVPLIHGTFGEDGKLARIIEQYTSSQKIVGSESASLALTIDKTKTLHAISDLGFESPKGFLTNADSATIYNQAKTIFGDTGRVVVKPNDGGSSDGAAAVDMSDLEVAVRRAQNYSHSLRIEEFIFGCEFSIVVLDDELGRPFALVPTEILVNQDKQATGIYSRLQKYLPGQGVRHRTPPVFDNKTIDTIRTQAHAIFKGCGLRDWARLDGFVANDGRIVWLEVNAIPGLGIDSLLFQQVAFAGSDHRHFCVTRINNALARQSLGRISIRDTSAIGPAIAIIGGGVSSEREVSRMSWLNVCEKITSLGRYDVRRAFQRSDGGIVEVPLYISLQHSVQDIESLIDEYPSAHALEWSAKVSSETPLDFGAPGSRSTIRLLSIADIAKECNYIFNALHGGDGENGVMQQQFDSAGVQYNGSSASVSRRCIDKHATAKSIAKLSGEYVSVPRQTIKTISGLKESLRSASVPVEAWRDVLRCDGRTLQDTGNHASLFVQWASGVLEEIANMLGSEDGLVIKPLDDGCSSGVIVCSADLTEGYNALAAIIGDCDEISMRSLGGRYLHSDEERRLVLPYRKSDAILFEQNVSPQSVEVQPIEMTIGVVATGERLVALFPSETPSDYGVLTLEEKFCKGVGVNATPAPSLSPGERDRIRLAVAECATRIGIEGYARIDVIYHKLTGQIFVIDVNTLPGLTPATVLFTQAQLTPGIELTPAEFLEHVLVESGKGRRSRVAVQPED